MLETGTLICERYVCAINEKPTKSLKITTAIRIQACDTGADVIIGIFGWLKTVLFGFAMSSECFLVQSIFAHPISPIYNFF